MRLAANSWGLYGQGDETKDHAHFPVQSDDVLAGVVRSGSGFWFLEFRVP